MNLNTIAFIDANPNSPITDGMKAKLKEATPSSKLIFVKNCNELMEITDDADAIFMWPDFAPDFMAWCRKASSLKWVHMFISGVDAVMASDIGKMEHIRISSTKGIHGAPMSDQTIAYIFSFLRQFPAGIRSQIKHEWNSDLMTKCDESFNKTVGIIGLGAIGTEIARKCKLLDMRVVAAKRNPIDCKWVDMCYSIAELDKLLRESDFVVLILPLTKESENMIGEAQFKIMKNSAYLINIARGGIVDHDALVRALESDEIAGAALDIFTKEPLPSENPLWDMTNVIISHHTSPHSPYYMQRAIDLIFENIKRFLADRPLLYEVDRNTGV
jgi:phosphoglycerate dehydrogenase-like enzyme